MVGEWFFFSWINVNYDVFGRFSIRFGTDSGCSWQRKRSPGHPLQLLPRASHAKQLKNKKNVH